MGLKEVLCLIAAIVLLIAWTITYYTNGMLIKQNNKLYRQVKACYESIDKSRGE